MARAFQAETILETKRRATLKLNNDYNSYSLFEVQSYAPSSVVLAVVVRSIGEGRRGMSNWEARGSCNLVTPAYSNYGQGYEVRLTAP